MKLPGTVLEMILSASSEEYRLIDDRDQKNFLGTCSQHEYLGISEAQIKELESRALQHRAPPFVAGMLRFKILGTSATHVGRHEGRLDRMWWELECSLVPSRTMKRLRTYLNVPCSSFFGLRVGAVIYLVPRSTYPSEAHMRLETTKALEFP